MFSFRRRSSKKSLEDTSTPQLKSSPSLPSLLSQGIPWPENLVDVNVIHEDSRPKGRFTRGAAKISLQGDRIIPFHKPFRGPSVDSEANGGTISSLYMSHPPSAFDIWKSSNIAPPTTRQRRTRQPPTFNLMVVGGRGTGKSSFLRLLLGTADISPTATPEQRSEMERFLNTGTKSTQEIRTACVEICESRFDSVLFSVIDTPGLDFSEGRELRLERQVAGIINYLDTQYADTMSEESKVIRQSKGDQHIHLCVYMIHPSSILPASAHHVSVTLPRKTHTQSEGSISGAPDASTKEDDSDSSAEQLTMSPAEIRVIRGLSARANVLPVIARADSLTDDKLSAVKDAVRRGLQEAGLDFGVFGPATAPAHAATKQPNGNVKENGNGNGHANGNGHTNGNGQAGPDAENDESSDEEEEKAAAPSRPVVKLRPGRIGSMRSPSRSRRDLRSIADTDGISYEDLDQESVANIRFSAHIVRKTDLSALLPFALIAPENASKRKEPKARPLSIDSKTSVYSSAIGDVTTEEGHTATSKLQSSSLSVHSQAYLNGPPADLKGVFTRKFRWGIVDVLDPNHCDFAALRTAVLSTHLKALKTRTREVLYEKYRTEKLVAWRGTRKIDHEETKRMLDALEI